MITTDDFQLNEYISLDGVEGYITFISNDYITYCICEYDKPREERIQELMKERPSNYIQDVLDGNHYIQKRESPLSE